MTDNKTIEPKFIYLHGGSYVKGPVRISNIALKEIQTEDPTIKAYQRMSFFIPKNLPEFIQIGNYIYIPEEIL